MTTTTKSLTARLIDVQMKLNAPKNQNNTFGGYTYRSAEDILEAVKPLLSDEGLLLTISDDLVNVGDRYYVKATARVENIDGSIGIISVDSYARESQDKKGMDAAQITGSASSYARKYALNGLFAIDDSKDADTDEHHKQTTPKQTAPGVPPLDRAKKQINETLEAQGYNTVTAKMTFINAVLQHSTIDNLNEADLVMDQLENEASND